MTDVLTPFRYCEYKETDVERDLIDCGTLAGAVIGGMSFCGRHETMIQAAMAGEVTLVRAADKGDTLGMPPGVDGRTKEGE